MVSFPQVRHKTQQNNKKTTIKVLIYTQAKILSVNLWKMFGK